MELPTRKTLNGKFDAYCHVCWNAVYCLWIDDESPQHDKCPFGADSVYTCSDAMGREKLRAWVQKTVAEQKAQMGPKESANG